MYVCTSYGECDNTFMSVCFLHWKEVNPNYSIFYSIIYAEAHARKRLDVFIYVCMYAYVSVFH